MEFLRCASVLLFVALACFPGKASASQDKDREALIKTGDAIRAAFVEGDVAAAMRYHHPAVNKALSFQKVLLGREAVAADLRATFAQSHLEFVENRVESLLIEGNTAVEQAVFTLKGTPLKGGETFLFSGRTMVVYVRYKDSPTGWASIREVIQPAAH